jgi:hypothetical protein
MHLSVQAAVHFSLDFCALAGSMENATTTASTKNANTKPSVFVIVISPNESQWREVSGHHDVRSSAVGGLHTEIRCSRENGRPAAGSPLPAVA